MCKHLFAALLVTVALTFTANADILNVPDPFSSIQAAIDAAVDTDEVVVAAGTYFETINFLGKAITVRSSDGPAVTTIDAQGAGSVVTCNSGEGPGTVLEGFTITGGTGFLIDGSTHGGGMNNFLSSPTVTNCEFSGNTAVVNGGGMNNLNGSSPTVTNCTFAGNTADVGGGMRCATLAVECNAVGAGDALFPGVNLSWVGNAGCWGVCLGLTATGFFLLVHLIFSSQLPAAMESPDPSESRATFSATAASLGLDSRSTRTDGIGDSSTVDLGFHYPS